jgi:hypothetical protein
VEAGIASGRFAHEDPGVIDVATLPPEKLEPVPFDILKKAGVVEDATPTWVRQRQEEAKRKAAKSGAPATTESTNGESRLLGGGGTTTTPTASNATSAPCDDDDRFDDSPKEVTLGLMEALSTAGEWKSSAETSETSLFNRVLRGGDKSQAVDDWCREFAAMAEPGKDACVEPPLQKGSTLVLRKKVVFLGPWATNDELSRISEQWLQRLGDATAIEFDCAVARPPFSNEDDLECPGFWLNP